jgi:branched-subunit amino acid permease
MKIHNESGQSNLNNVRQLLLVIHILDGHKISNRVASGKIHESLAPFMCVHACLLTCLSLSVQIAEAFKLLFPKGTLQN